MKTCLFSTILKDLPIEEAISKSAEIGYEGIEIRTMSHLPEDTSINRVRELSRMIEEAGLKVANVYINLGGYSRLTDSECSERFDTVLRYLDMAAELGSPLIKDNPGGPSPGKASEEQLKKSCLWIGKAADAAASRGVGIALEIHYGNLLENGESSVKYLDLVDRENVGIIYDPGNMNIVPTPYGPEVIRSLGERIVHFHVKDSAKTGKEDDPNRRVSGHGFVFWNRMLGEGEVDHEPLFRALKEIGYDGFLSTECQVIGGDPVLIAEQEYRHMRNILDRIGA